MNGHFAFLFKSTASLKFFSSSTAKLIGPFSFAGNLVSKLGSKHASSPFSMRCAVIFISLMVQSSPQLPLKAGVFEVVLVTTSTFVIAALAFARVPATISLVFLFNFFLSLKLHKVTAAALYLSMPEAV
jgi:hypothetical protein